MACDYDFQKMASDYDPLTRPGSPSPALPKKPRHLPATKFRPISAWPAIGNRPLTPWAYTATARHTAQDGTKSRTWGSLPHLENGLYMACTSLAIAVLCTIHSVTALAIPHKPTI